MSSAAEARRLRKERILKKGSDRLNRIKSSLSKPADESPETTQHDIPHIAHTHEVQQNSEQDGNETPSAPVESSIPAETHNELAAAAVKPQSIADSLSAIAPKSNGAAPTPRRRVGNLARKAKNEAATNTTDKKQTMESIDKLLEQSLGTNAEGDLKSKSSNSSLKADIAPPPPSSSATPKATHAEDKLSPRTKTLLESIDRDQGQSGWGLQNSPLFTPTPRQFSFAGLSKTVFQLFPTVALMGYTIWKERSYCHTVNGWRTRQKMADLIVERPDPTLAEWAPGSRIAVYILVAQFLLFGSYIVLNTNATLNAQTAPRLALMLSQRVINSLCLLVFLTGISIIVSYIIL